MNINTLIAKPKSKSAQIHCPFSPQVLTKCETKLLFTYYLWTGADTKLATPLHSTDTTITFNHEGMHRTDTYS